MVRVLGCGYGHNYGLYDTSKVKIKIVEQRLFAEK